MVKEKTLESVIDNSVTVFVLLGGKEQRHIVVAILHTSVLEISSRFAAG